jgi:hypothetical protein
LLQLSIGVIVQLKTKKTMRCYKKSMMEVVVPDRLPGYIEEAEKRNKSTDDSLYCFEEKDIEELKKFRKTAKQLPSTMEMAKNLTTATKQEIKARLTKAPPVSEEEQKRRMEICRGCEHFTPNIPELPEHQRKQERCVKCGCFMNFKTKLRSQHCPVQKW